MGLLLGVPGQFGKAFNLSLQRRKFIQKVVLRLSL